MGQATAIVFDNARVAAARNRNSSCYVANGHPAPIVAHRKSIAMFDNALHGVTSFVQ